MFNILSSWCKFLLQHSARQIITTLISKLLQIKTIKRTNRAFSLTWPATMQIYWNKRERLQRRRVQSTPTGLVGTLTRPRFHCFGTPIWPPWRHVKTLHSNLAKQLRFNHQVSFKTHHEKSAVMMMGLVIGVFLVCYGMYLRCSFLILFQTSTTITSSPCHDENYKIPVLVLNSAINPLAYAFFKRDIKKEFKRLVGAVF